MLKYQVNPQIVLTATNSTVSGKPRRIARPAAEDSELRASRSEAANDRRASVHSRIRRRGKACSPASCPENRSRHAARSKGRVRNRQPRRSGSTSSAPNNDGHEDVPRGGYERGDQTEPGIAGLHAGQVNDKQHHARDRQPIQFDAAHDGRARGAGCDARAKQFMFAEVKPAIGVYIGRVGRLVILSLDVPGR